MKSIYLLTAISIILFTAIGLFANSDYFYETTTTEISEDFHNQIYQFSYYKDSLQSDVLILLN